MHGTLILNTANKKTASEFLIFSVLKLYSCVWRCPLRKVFLEISVCNFITKESLVQVFSCELVVLWISGFYVYEHLHTHGRVKFQNVIKRKLANCFGQLLHIHGIQDDVDSACGVCICKTFLNFIADLMNTLQ